MRNSQERAAWNDRDYMLVVVDLFLATVAIPGISLGVADDLTTSRRVRVVEDVDPVKVAGIEQASSAQISYAAVYR